MGYKYDLIHLKEFVCWHLTFRLAVKIPCDLYKLKQFWAVNVLETFRAKSVEICLMGI